MVPGPDCRHKDEVKCLKVETQSPVTLRRSFNRPAGPKPELKGGLNFQ